MLSQHLYEVCFEPVPLKCLYSYSNFICEEFPFAEAKLIRRHVRKVTNEASLHPESIFIFFWKNFSYLNIRNESTNAPSAHCKQEKPEHHLSRNC